MSVLLQTATQFLVQVMLLLSILLVIRGHNYPGGGFVGALVAALSSALYTLAFGLRVTLFNRWMPKVIILGLFCMFTCFILPLFWGYSALTGMWINISLMGRNIKIGTPLLFDFGVYFLIAGSLSWLVTELEDQKL